MDRMSRKYRLTIMTRDGVVNLEQNYGDGATYFAIRHMIEAQYGPGSFMDLREVTEKSSAPTSTETRTTPTPARTSPSRGKSEGPGLLAMSFTLIRYLPVWLPIGLVLYVTFELVRSWHPVLIGVTLILALVSSLASLIATVKKVSRQVAAVCGATLYAVAFLTVKWQGPAIASLFGRKNWTGLPLDWLWTGALACGLGLVGALSFAACHEALLNISRR
jgi:hypothetical protein